MGFNPMQIMGMLQNSGNPLQIIQAMAGNNPQMQQAMKMAQSGNPREVVTNLAKEQGVSAEQLQQIAAQWGINL